MGRLRKASYSQGEIYANLVADKSLVEAACDGKKVCRDQSIDMPIVQVSEHFAAKRTLNRSRSRSDSLLVLFGVFLHQNLKGLSDL